MKKLLSALLATLLALSCLTLVAFAAEETGATDTTAEDTGATDTTTEDTTAPQEVVHDPHHIIFNSSLSKKPNILASTNDLTKGGISKNDEWPGIKMQIADPEDPHVAINYDNYVKRLGIEPQNIEDTPFIALKVLTDEIAFDDFDLYYCTGDVLNPVEECRTASDYAIDAEDGTVYFIFDLTDDATGAMHLFRIDVTGAEEGALMYLTEMAFFATEQEAMEFCDYEEPTTSETTEPESTDAPTSEEITSEILTAAPVTEEEGGCGSIMTAGLASLALVMLGAVCIKKKN